MEKGAHGSDFNNLGRSFIGHVTPAFVEFVTLANLCVEIVSAMF